jgi:hypothetical protein
VQAAIAVTVLAFHALLPVKSVLEIFGDAGVAGFARLAANLLGPSHRNVGGECRFSFPRMIGVGGLGGGAGRGSKKE